ncbi:ArsR family transcriptional regulator [Halorussus sp. AFM4]|uniref:ArsR family transcriptional regulator n=1 Tax=Halorussus sp. AFM4 TaxID=3421651 RepID=UPI003EB9FACB
MAGTDRERNDQGQFDDALDPQTVLDVFKGRTDASEPLDAGEVADELGWSRRTALRKLDSLTDEGKLRSKKVGSGRVWWIPESDADGSINPDDPFWNAEPHAGDEPLGEDDIDDILYGEVES